MNKIYVDTIREVAELSLELYKSGASFECCKVGTVWIIKLTGNK